MSGLRVSLSKIGERGALIDTRPALSELQPPGGPSLPVHDIWVRGELTPAGTEYLFRGRVSGVFTHACDRCLTAVDVQVEVEAVWALAPGALPTNWEEAFALEDEEEEEGPRPCLFSGTEIDLAPFAWEELALAEPAKYLCEENCPGLCPRCGARLKLGPCGCSALDSADNRISNRGFGKLREMFPGASPNGLED